MPWFMNKKSWRKQKTETGEESNKKQISRHLPQHVDATLTKLTFWEVTVIFVFLVVTLILTSCVFWVAWQPSSSQETEICCGLVIFFCEISAAELENDAFLGFLYELTSLVTMSLMNLSLMTLTSWCLLTSLWLQVAAEDQLSPCGAVHFSKRKENDQKWTNYRHRQITLKICIKNNTWRNKH